jgi:hypothetical protein
MKKKEPFWSKSITSLNNMFGYKSKRTQQSDTATQLKVIEKESTHCSPEPIISINSFPEDEYNNTNGIILKILKEKDNIPQYGQYVVYFKVADAKGNEHCIMQRVLPFTYKKMCEEAQEILTDLGRNETPILIYYIDNRWVNIDREKCMVNVRALLEEQKEEKKIFTFDVRIK